MQIVMGAASNAASTMRVQCATSLLAPVTFSSAVFVEGSFEVCTCRVSERCALYEEWF